MTTSPRAKPSVISATIDLMDKRTKDLKEELTYFKHIVQIQRMIIARLRSEIEFANIERVEKEDADK